MQEKEKFHNSLAARLILVAAAFLLVFLSSAIAMYTTLNEKLRANAEVTMDDTQAFFSRIIREPEAVLNLIANNIEGIYNRGEGTDAINAYIAETSTDEFKKNLKVLQYYSTYIYYENTGEFFEGLGWDPGEDYNPRSRPWYMAASGTGGKTAMTQPYIDMNTGEIIVSYARQVFDETGRLFGTVCIDVLTGYLRDLAVNKQITPNSYGFMVDVDSVVIMHPNASFEGETYATSNPGLARFRKYIAAGKDISLERVDNYEGMPSLIFGRQLDNGWYFILLIPSSEYYAELYRMIVFSGVISSVFAGLLIITFVRIERAKKRADEEFRKKILQLAEAEGATRAKSVFLARMSHEIRTPMNAILGITEIVLQRDGIDPDVREALGKIYTSGDLLLGIINDILDLSKIEAGKLELVTVAYEMASLISDTVQINMSRIGSKPIEFKLEVSDNTPVTVIGDEMRVKQILNNILSNAFKYTAEGTVTLDVSVEPAQAHHCGHGAAGDSDPQSPGQSDNLENNIFLVFKVSDTGQGMTKQQVSELFSEYTRFNQEANRSTEGTGLGMNITQNLVQRMGGGITVESEPGRGSVFTVRILQEKADDEVLSREMIENLRLFRSAASRAQLKRTQITREPMPYGKVLVVDDVETNIYVVSGLMAPYGLNIDSAESGYDALKIIDSGREYDVIFMDHMMPGMDGVETTLKIREKGYKLPIIALTANAVAGQADMFLKNGFDDYISKPIDVRQLNNVLNKWVRDKQPPEVIAAARAEAARLRAASGADLEALGIDAGLAEIFVRDAVKSLTVLDEITDKQGDYSEDELRQYVVRVHGLKSALANIGQTELSASALALELAGRDGNVKMITAGTPGFLRDLRAFLKKIAPDSVAEEKAEALSDADVAYLIDKLHELKAACDELDEASANDIVAELRQSPCGKAARGVLGKISELLLHSDFDEAGVVASDYASSLSKLKPLKATPDDETIARLIEACVASDAETVEKKMEELDSYRYEDGADLIDWLRDRVAAGEFDEIVKMLE